MSNPSLVTLSLPAGVTNGIALSQTPGAASNLTLNGSLVSGGVANLVTPQRAVAVSASAGDTTQTLTFTGTDRNGNTISEAVTLNGTTQVNTKQDFLTVTKVAISAGTAGALTVGTNGIGSTDWVLDNFLAPTWMLAVAVHIKSGSATYTVEHTYDDPNSWTGMGTGNSALPSSMEPASYSPPLAWANPTLQNMNADGEFQYVAWPVMAHRLTITAGTGTVTMQSLQAGIGSP